MPRVLLRSPLHDRSKSLGWLATAWLEHFVVHGPGAVQGEPVEHGDEFTGFIVDCYAMGDHPSNNHLLYDSGFFSRPKGSDKSGLGGRLGLFEGLGPCRFAGWAKGGEIYRDPWGMGFAYRYQPGEPMGRRPRAPVVQCMATEIGQVGNVYETIYYNLLGDDEDYGPPPPLSFVPGVVVGQERILLPGGGEIRAATASASAKDGKRETFVIFDESHLYTLPELRRMYKTVTRNLRKRKLIDGTWYLETTTMFAPGENSIAELTYAEAEALRENRKQRGRHRLLYDHRYGECKNLSDEQALRVALVDAYGEAMRWNDLDGLVDEFYDLRNDAADSRRYFLNARTSSSDSWLTESEWSACKRPDKALRDGDFVALGLDGSVSDDATALCAVRVDDGHLELLGVWEKPEGPAGDGWQVDREAVDAAVAAAMRRFAVAGFYMDPAHWQDYADKFTAEFGAKMKVRASERRPLEWWCNRPRPMVAALERFHEAVIDERVTYTPADDRVGEEAERALALTRHALNACRRPTRSGLQIGKPFQHSPRKIDAIMAAVLAYECASDARAMGSKARPTSYVPRRIH